MPWRGVRWKKKFSLDMACEAFERQLTEYAELSGEERTLADAHLAQCAACRDFWEALKAVDAHLSAQFTRSGVSADFASQVRRRVTRQSSVERLSYIPEILDFVGWGAIVALLGLAAWWFSPLIPL